MIDEIAAEYAGKLKCYVLNTDVDLQVVEDYEIKAVPVVLLFKNGKKCESGWYHAEGVLCCCH